jgi:hypothetical protein
MLSAPVVDNEFGTPDNRATEAASNVGIIDGEKEREELDLPFLFTGQIILKYVDIYGVGYFWPSFNL